MMFIHRLISPELVAHRLHMCPLKTITRRPQLFSQCLYFSSTKCKLSSISTEDIKRKVLKNLNATPEVKSGVKEIILYESNRDNYYRMFAMIGILNYIIWVFVANFGVFWYSNKLVAEEIETNEIPKGIISLIKSMLSSNEQMIKLSVFFLIIGHLIICATVAFCVRVVNHMSLIPSRSGVDKVRIYCYSVFGLPNNYHKHDIPLNEITALKNRLDSKSSYIPLKVKGQPLKFRIDKKGNFLQPTIYDQTVGIKRDL